MQKPIIALMYDFDKTLTDRDMQEYVFIPSLGMECKDFWAACDAMMEKHNMDQILATMYYMIDRSKETNVITADSLKEQGKSVKYYPGVPEWFGMINEYGKSKGVTIEHYIISSGLKKVIEGTSIAGEFKEIFASEFVYDEHNVPYWPAVVLNYTSKTQFLFRVNKGIFKISDHDRLNEHWDERKRRIPFDNMVYIGDGYTDVPIMKLTKLNGGHSIAVFDEVPATAMDMLKAERINFIAKADYRKDGELYKIVTRIIDMLAAKSELRSIYYEQSDRTREG